MQQGFDRATSHAGDGGWFDRTECNQCSRHLDSGLAPFPAPQLFAGDDLQAAAYVRNTPGSSLGRKAALD